MYYDIETCIMVNQSVNEFYNRFLFKIYALPQDYEFPLETYATFFDNVSHNVRKLFISEGVQVTPIPPTENNHQGNQRLLLVRNVAVETERKTRTIQVAVQTARESRHPRKFMGMLGSNPSTRIASLISSFQYKESKFRVAEAMGEYVLDSVEAAY